MRRVVVTGMGGVTSLGNDWSTIKTAMNEGKTGICYMPDWERFKGIHTRLAAPVKDFNIYDRYTRKQMRTMGRVSQMAVYASERAIEDAGITGSDLLKNGRTGIAYGSSYGSPDAVLGFYELKALGASKNLTATNYIRMMGQTTAVNIGLFFEITGRIIPTSSACTSGSQAIGYGFESIQMGKADMMVCGGAEELDITDAATFDTLFATSTKNDKPSTTPSPYDQNRDGLVIGEGAATLVLEEYEHALKRGAKIYAEIVGFACNSDGHHATLPQAATMQKVMELSLQDAGLKAHDINFISGHGTATEWGDIAETQASFNVFGAHIPIHSLKGFFGHTLGACGSMEAWLTIEMMRDKWFCPTPNLENVDPRCGGLDYMMHTPRELDVKYFMSNNFAFGGINTSLIIKRFD
jgi:3-oxoacyl-[acyl-carrier-protein] synthase II